MDNYLSARMAELVEFKKLVLSEGIDLIKNVLNEEWFNDIKNKIISCAEDEHYLLDGRYVPYRWLCEENDWNEINDGLRLFEVSNKKHKVLRNKLNLIKSRDWFTSTAAACEIAGVCKFSSDGILVDIDEKINVGVDKNVDLVINIDNRNLLIEITGMNTALVSPDVRFGVKSVDEMISKFSSKLYGKVERQLQYSDRPAVLLIFLNRLSTDQIAARMAIREVLKNFINISAVLVSDTYRLKYGTCYFNENAQYCLTENETLYFSKLLNKNLTIERLESKN